MSWSTPIEDGPLFGGLYLHGLCRRWQVRRDEEAAGKARRIAAGLMKLSELGATEGFIGRGVAADGSGHYPASSEDQMFPWVYGLCRYLGTELPSADERKRVVTKIVATVEAVEKNRWRVPCDPAGFGERGDLTRATVHDAVRLLFLLRTMHALTGEDRWLREFRARLEERVGKGNRTRLEVIEDGLDLGPSDKKDTFIWTNAMSQAALRVLVDEVEDDGVRAKLRRGLVAGARSAAPHLVRAHRWDNASTLRFDVDWRFLKASWKPQQSCAEAIALAREQLSLWAAHNPRSPYEDDTVREPLFAAWIVLLSGDAGLRAEYGPEIEAMLQRYDWSHLYTATFFVAVNVFYEGL
ncbi:MAG: hypothetical protein ABJF10_15680 [Chthoniobacter sp.]|uniref:hypothetical protein n=1 Tax=Chthoniobacter sp. TaxID=2510640 RepID=UPI0032A2E01B